MTDAPRLPTEAPRELEAALPPKARSGSSVPEPATQCLNCGSALSGRFCADCGQKAQSLRQPLRAFAAESISEYWGLDGRLWRSARDLLLRPGTLTVDFIEGRRTTALRPFRLYLTATLLFFVTLSLSGSDSNSGADVLAEGDRRVLTLPTFSPDSLLATGDAADALDAWATETGEQTLALVLAADILGRSDSFAEREARFAADSLRARALRFGRLRDSVRALPETDSLRAAATGLPPAAAPRPERDGSGDGFIVASADVVRAMPDWLKGGVTRQIERARTPAEQRSAQRAALDALVGQIPTAMFFVLPLFAVLLKVLYAGGGGIELRGRQRPVPPTRAPAGSGAVRRALDGFRTTVWQTRQAAARWQVRRRIRAARRPWRRTLRRLRDTLPARVRVRRTGWLRRAATARRARFYAEHVVFTLHVHAFAFVVFWVLLVLRATHAPGALGGWLVVAIPVYFLLAQRRVYAQTWGKTLVKSVLLGLSYSVVLVLGTVVAAALAARMG